jgi:hypothetical protein
MKAGRNAAGNLRRHRRREVEEAETTEQDYDKAVDCDEERKDRGSSAQRMS